MKIKILVVLIIYTNNSFCSGNYYRPNSLAPVLTDTGSIVLKKILNLKTDYEESIFKKTKDVKKRKRKYFLVLNDLILHKDSYKNFFLKLLDDKQEIEKKIYFKFTYYPPYLNSFPPCYEVRYKQCILLMLENLNKLSAQNMRLDCNLYPHHFAGECRVGK